MTTRDWMHEHYFTPIDVTDSTDDPVLAPYPLVMPEWANGLATMIAVESPALGLGIGVELWTPDGLWLVADNGPGTNLATGVPGTAQNVLGLFSTDLITSWNVATLGDLQYMRRAALPREMLLKLNTNGTSATFKCHCWWFRH